MGLAAGFVIMMLAAIGAGDGLKAGEHRGDPSQRDRQERQIEKRSNDGNVEYIVPVEGVVPRSLVDTWGALRSEGRSHEGIDIFAKRNTPVIASIDGRIVRQGVSERGGNVVWVVGDDGRRHYYAHLEAFSEHQTGERVRRGETIGYVGNSGNAITTPTHLHYGVYTSQGAINPYPLLTGRETEQIAAE